MLPTLFALLILPTAPSAARTVAPRRVTAAYLRKHDPELVARAFADADTPEGRRLAAALLPPDVLATRTRAMRRLKPSLEALRGKGRAAGPTYETIASDVLDATKALDMGTGVQLTHGGWEPRYQYYAYATRSGSLSVEEGPGSEISIDEIVIMGDTFQGGKLKGSYATGKGPWHIEAGQEYAIVFKMANGKVGDFARTFTVRDGHRTALNLSGKIVAAKTAIGLAMQTPTTPFRLTQNDSLDGLLLFTGLSNTVGSPVLDATCDLPGVKVEGSLLPQLLPNEKKTATPSFNLYTDHYAPDGMGTVTFTARTLEGTGSATVKVPIKVETTFSKWEDVELDEGTVHARLDLTFSDAGYWSIDVHTWSTAKEDAIPLVAFAFDFPSPGGSVAPGFQVEGPLKESPYDKADVHIDGKLYNFVHYWSFYGWDDRLRNIPPDAPLPVVLMVGKPGALASAGPKWADWQKAHPFSPLQKATNAWLY